MSVTAVGGTNPWFAQWASAGAATPTSGTTPAQSIAQLGQDLQAGNLSAAQTDYLAIGNSSPDGSTANDTNSFAQQWGALGQALQNGDLSGAQQDFSQLQQTLGANGVHHGHHHHHGGAGASASSAVGAAQTTQGTDPFEAAFQQIGSSLGTGDITGAQSAFSQLQSMLGDSGSALVSPTIASTLASNPGSIVDLTA